MATPTIIKTLQIKKDEDTIYKLTIEDLLKKSEADNDYAPKAAATNPYLKKSDGDSYYAPVAPEGEIYAMQSDIATAIYNYSQSGSVPSGTIELPSHTHSVGEIDGITATLSNYATVGHQHSFSEITNKPSEYTPSSHTHSAYVNITSITATISGSTTSDYIPTEAAIIKYLNSLAIPNGSNIAFPQS